MLFIAVAIDLVLFATIQLVESNRAVAIDEPALVAPAPVAAGLDAGPAPPAWAMCMAGERGEPPATVAITYLDAQRDDAVTAAELRGWFGDLDPATVQVWRLELVDGRRRISFELPADRWPRWRELAATLTGNSLCDALRGELVARRVGRPRSAADAGAGDRETRSRHDLEFFFARRDRLYRSRVAMGTLAELTQPRLDELVGWTDDGLTGSP